MLSHRPPALTLDLVRVCTAASTRAKFPLPKVSASRTYLPMHLTCLEEDELAELAVLALLGGRGGCSPEPELILDELWWLVPSAVGILPSFVRTGLKDSRGCIYCLILLCCTCLAIRLTSLDSINHVEQRTSVVYTITR